MSDAPRAMRQPLGLKLGSAAFLVFWCVLASFPIVWITLMSFKAPVDAFAANPLDVILGPATRDRGNGLSALDLIAGLLVLFFTVKLAFSWLPGRVAALSPPGLQWAGWIIGVLAYGLGFLVLFFAVLPGILGLLNPILGPLGTPLVGLTTEHYHSIWVERQFYQNFINSLIVTGGTVTISLTVGTLAGYGLARSGSTLAFWILIVALVFRALPHSVLLAGYLPVFVNSAEILRPWLGEGAPTLYGQPLAVIAVLVSINQPFTIWMLRSFFQNIPTELDEAARVDGCTPFPGLPLGDYAGDVAGCDHNGALQLSLGL